MFERTLKPERCYSVNKNITMSDIEKSLRDNETITGAILEYDGISRNIIVYLGNNIKGYLSIDELTIEDFKYFDTNDDSWPKQLKTLFQQRLIRVKVIEVQENGRIVLSRRKNQLEAFDKILSNPMSTVYHGKITKIDDTNLFIDIGEGIISKCHVTEFSTTRIEVREWCKVGDYARVKIIGVDEDKFFIATSRKRAYSKEQAYADLKSQKIGSKIAVRIAAPVYKGYRITGYFVEISPVLTGIADVSDNKLYNFGETAYAILKKVDAKNFKIKLDLT